MAEVSDKTGHGRQRSCDFMVMGFWPSRGLDLHGIEVKASRGDWLRELKDPNKQENHFKYCDYFWLLTENHNVAFLEEIPETWGWMQVKGSKIFTVKKAPKLNPEAISKSFLCAMLRRAQSKEGFTHTSSIQDKIDAAFERGKSNIDYEHRIVKQNYETLQEQIQKFEKHTGISIPRHRYAYGDSIEKIGKAVTFLKNGGADSIEKRLLGLEDTASNLLMNIRSGLQALKKDNG